MLVARGLMVGGTFGVVNQEQLGPELITMVDTRIATRVPGLALDATLQGSHADHSNANVNAQVFAGIWLVNSSNGEGEEHTVNSAGGLGTDFSPNWLTGEGVNSNYWAFATVLSGSLNAASETEDTWLRCNVDRIWWLDKVGAGTNSAFVGVRIATDASGANVVASKGYWFSALYIAV